MPRPNILSVIARKNNVTTDWLLGSQTDVPTLGKPPGPDFQSLDKAELEALARDARSVFERVEKLLKRLNR